MIRPGMTTPGHDISLLRIYGPTENISAQVFDELFRKNIGTLFHTGYMTSRAFAALSSDPARLLAVLSSWDYICPDYRMMAVVPWLMEIRRKNGLSFGILFISHSPGLYALEWLLIRDLVCDRDLIVAPSHFAEGVIRLLAPSLAPHVETISHPLDLKPYHAKSRNRGDRIVTLSRIAEDKLIHRQIDAMARVVHTHGYGHLHMVIGGRLTDPDSGELTSYARLLQFKIRQLDLESHVRLAGEIPPSGKHDFFKGSFVSVNLSRTLEEAFPKASVEALSFGIPVVATRWNGFAETVGHAGILLDLDLSHGRADVDPDELAKTLITLYENPLPAETCLNQIKPYNRSTLMKRYRDLLAGRASQSAKPKGRHDSPPGLLDTLSFLSVFTHDERMDFHHQWVADYLEAVNANQPQPFSGVEAFFRFFIADGLKGLLTGWYAFKRPSGVMHGLEPAGPLDDSPAAGDFREKMRQSILISNNSHSKKTLLKIFSERPDPELLKQAITRFSGTGDDLSIDDYYAPYADFLDGRYPDVCRFYQQHFMSEPPGLEQAGKLRLWSKAALLCGETNDVTDYLAQWLRRFTTEPEAVVLHLDYLNLLIHGPESPGHTIREQFEIVNALCYDRTLARRLEVLAYAR